MQELITFFAENRIAQNNLNRIHVNKQRNWNDNN
jgi:hypothetical protein